MATVSGYFAKGLSLIVSTVLMACVTLAWLSPLIMVALVLIYLFGGEGPYG